MTRIFRTLCEDALLSDGKYNLKKEKKFFGRLEITHSEGKENGHNYITITSKEELFCNPEAKDRLSSEIKRSLLFYMKKFEITESSKIFVACLGNEKITADSLGGKVADKLIVTAHLNKDGFLSGTRYGNLCAIKCGVSGVTGIESFDVIYGLIKQIKPDFVIVVDTLACSSVTRLGCTVQFSDGGIEPGGGVGNGKKSLDYNSLKIPVLAIGVPLVIYAVRMISEYAEGKIKDVREIQDLVIATKETDFIANDFGEVIADAINKTVHNRLYL